MYLQVHGTEHGGEVHDPPSTACVISAKCASEYRQQPSNIERCAWRVALPVVARRSKLRSVGLHVRGAGKLQYSNFNSLTATPPL